MFLGGKKENSSKNTYIHLDFIQLYTVIQSNLKKLGFSMLTLTQCDPQNKKIRIKSF